MHFADVLCKNKCYFLFCLLPRFYQIDISSIFASQFFSLSFVSENVFKIRISSYKSQPVCVGIPI